MRRDVEKTELDGKGCVTDSRISFLPPKAVIGMVHVAALPGAPLAKLGVDELLSQAVSDAKTLADAGFDGLIIENMHDRPYTQGVKGPEVVAAMTRVGLAVREATGLPLGVQILSGGNREALAVASVVGAEFIRCENFVFAHVADEGVLLREEAGELLRYRRSINAEGVRIFCDVKKKHASHALTADLTLTDMAEAADFFRADGLVVTGKSTGKATDPKDIEELRWATELPILVGSGANPDSLSQLFAHADAVIVGSWIKKDGRWDREPDPERCERFVAAARASRGDDT